MENETLTAYQEISGDKSELNALLLSVQSWKFCGIQIFFNSCKSPMTLSILFILSLASLCLFFHLFYLKSFLLRSFPCSSLHPEDALYSTLPSGCSDFSVDLLEIKDYADITWWWLWLWLSKERSFRNLSLRKSRSLLAFQFHKVSQITKVLNLTDEILACLYHLTGGLTQLLQADFLMISQNFCIVLHQGMFVNRSEIQNGL